MQLRACAHANSKRNKGFVFGAILGFFLKKKMILSKFCTRTDMQKTLSVHQDHHWPQESKIGCNILLHVSVTIQEWLSSKSWSQRCWVVCVVSWYLLGGTQSSHLPRGLHGSGADQRNTLGGGSRWRALKVMLWESCGRKTFINSDLFSLQDKYSKKCTGLGVLCLSSRTISLLGEGKTTTWRYIRAQLNPRSDTN